jgi:cell division protein FtsL
MAAPVIAPRRPVAPRKPAASRKPAAAGKSSARKSSSATARSERNERALAKARATQRARPAAQRARAVTAPRPAQAPARRKSGAAKPRRATRPAASPVARVLNSRGMPLVDRILRGPGWVVMLGALLAGIVFLNVSVLELNRGIARTDTKSAQLERVNSALRARVAKLDSGERIQELAAARGFVMPQPGDVTYVRERASNASLAAQRMTPPTPPAGTVPTTTTPTTTTPTSTIPPSSTTTPTSTTTTVAPVTPTATTTVP